MKKNDILKFESEINRLFEKTKKIKNEIANKKITKNDIIESTLFISILSIFGTFTFYYFTKELASVYKADTSLTLPYIILYAFFIFFLLLPLSGLTKKDAFITAKLKNLTFTYEIKDDVLYNLVKNPIKFCMIFIFFLTIEIIMYYQQTKSSDDDFMALKTIFGFMTNYSFYFIYPIFFIASFFNWLSAENDEIVLKEKTNLNKELQKVDEERAQLDHELRSKIEESCKTINDIDYLNVLIEENNCWNVHEIFREARKNFSIKKGFRDFEALRKHDIKMKHNKLSITNE